MNGRATRIQLGDFTTIPMRTFHLAWMAFFVCFFAWFAVAPLMPLIRDELHLTKDQIATINIAAVGVTIFVRLLIGPLCDRYGARLTYTWLLALGSIPVIAIAFARSYEAFIFWRLCIGAIGASFVVTQFHTSIRFAPHVVGTANAAPAGWGNAGGGAAQAVMPVLAAALGSLAAEQAFGWRAALIVPGIMMLIMSAIYFRFGKDTPAGNINRAGVRLAEGQAQRAKAIDTFLAAARDYRVWLLFITYGACFGVELTIHNLAAVYYVDRFGLSLMTAGLYVGAFGLLALFARALGGIVSDRIAASRGLEGRVLFLCGMIFAEGIGLMAFSQMGTATMALVAMLIFGLFVHMACGATYSLVPFVNRRALGGVAGIIGAGGNVGAVICGFVVKGAATIQQSLLILGAAVTVSALCALAVRFTREQKAEERRLYEEALAINDAQAAPPSIEGAVAR